MSVNTYQILFLSASLTINIYLFTSKIKDRLGADSIVILKDAEVDEEVNSVITKSFGRKQIIAIANINSKAVTTVRNGYSAQFVKDTSRIRHTP